MTKMRVGSFRARNVKYSVTDERNDTELRNAGCPYFTMVAYIYWTERVRSDNGRIVINPLILFSLFALRYKKKNEP